MRGLEREGEDLMEMIVVEEKEAIGTPITLDRGYIWSAAKQNQTTHP